MLKKFIRSKLRALSVLALYILETGHCVCLEVVSIFPPFVLVKKTLQKAKKFVVIVEGFAR